MFKISLAEQFLHPVVKGEIISFSSSKPDPSFFPVKEIRNIYKNILKMGHNDLFQYSSPFGYYPLRELIAQHSSTNGYAVSPEEVIITSGSQSALNILIQTLLPYKGKIILEDPTYIGIEPLLTAKKSLIKSIAIKEDGFDLESLEKYLIRFPRNSPNLVYVIPDFQNPTGCLYTLERRKKLANLAKNFNFFIIEDEAYKNIFYDPAANLSSIRSFNRQKTITVGSFSKITMPDLRTGWMIIPKSILPSVIEYKKAVEIYTESLSQMVICEFWKRGLLEKHLKFIRKSYQKRRDHLLAALKKYMPSEITWSQTNGGFFIWLRGKRKLDTHKLYFSSIKKGVSFLPGFLFSYKNIVSGDMRLSFSELNEKEIEVGIYRLAEAVKRGLMGK